MYTNSILCIYTNVYLRSILYSPIPSYSQRFFIATSRQLQRMDGITRSPIYTHFQETVTGASSIRAYRQQVRFIEESERRVDNNLIVYHPIICANRCGQTLVMYYVSNILCNLIQVYDVWGTLWRSMDVLRHEYHYVMHTFYRWLAIRLEFIGNFIILFAALFAVIQRIYSDDIHLPTNGGLVGISITYALQITMVLNMLVRTTSELETNIVAVERTDEYSRIANEVCVSSTCAICL